MQDTSTAKTALPLRNDTIFGICEGIGEDFGISANWIRVPLCALVIWSPIASVAIYLGLGVAVAASRLLFPDRRSANSSVAISEQPANSDAEVRIAA
jgi:phage shock protein C